MLERFLQWYRDTQASKACLSKWAEVSDELMVAFYRHVEGCSSNKFADKVAARFFKLYREKNNELLASVGMYPAQVSDCERDTGDDRPKVA